MSTDRSASRRKWRVSHRSHIARYNARYNVHHKEQIVSWHARPENRQAAIERSKAWAVSNPQSVRKNRKNFRKRHPGYNTAYATEYKAAKRSRRVSWANQFFIDEAYRLAQLRTKATGFKWEVDHIIPLRSRVVCGLHCEQNLEVVTKSRNCSKGNRIWLGMPEGPNAASRPLALLQQPI